MKEHNFFITVKYGLKKSSPEKIFEMDITGTTINEKYIIKEFKEFIRDINNKIKN